MDKSALYKLSYGMFLISTADEEGRYGCVVNTLQQVTSSPVNVTVAVNKQNYTAEKIQKTNKFAAVVLTQKAEMDLIAEFGFKTSKDVDKFANFAFALDEAGMPYVTDCVAAQFSCEVTGTLDAGSHIVFLAKVTDARVLSGDEVMTYNYYRTVKKGTTPPKASSFNLAKG
jgi:flavin reductase (DIM6/NTAB) family NADH-FMN oxidoreductase RutF